MFVNIGKYKVLKYQNITTAHLFCTPSSLICIAASLIVTSCNAIITEGSECLPLDVLHCGGRSECCLGN